ncbi:MAG: hypothetical protein HQK53_12005, partial [Oligoflexia bacterium]|nr:hypothetical protein [Oligoflexia bacterium]
EITKLIRWLRKFVPEIVESEYSTTLLNYLSKEGFCLELRELVAKQIIQYRYQPAKNSETRVTDKLIVDLKKRFIEVGLRKTRTQLANDHRRCIQAEEEIPVMDKLRVVEEQLMLAKKGD